MKHLELLLAATLLISTASAQTPATAPKMPSLPGGLPGLLNDAEIRIPSPAADLARGYAVAITQMSPTGLVIYLKTHEKVIAVRGVRSARAIGGVLLVTFSAGDSMAVNAENIVMITDGAHKP